MTKPTYYAAAIAVLLATSAPAHAEQAATERVSYSDLDLTSPKGAKTVLHRIEVAAAKVCAQPHTSLFSQADERHCQSAAVAQAVGDLGSTHVAALHAKSDPWSARFTDR